VAPTKGMKEARRDKGKRGSTRIIYPRAWVEIVSRRFIKEDFAKGKKGGLVRDKIREEDYYEARESPQVIS